eukprot:TRINITY_DN4302_c0_g1_i1.p3 TRINITY_DN4302_c0_g1~~TRINITY_DN4302_c0_g1_i1.p3  ORF type:complete len:326 (+),score=114.78 TRINITY_DN4302_c0_g1_i1:66-1043(+)
MRDRRMSGGGAAAQQAAGEGCAEALAQLRAAAARRGEAAAEVQQLQAELATLEEAAAQPTCGARAGRTGSDVLFLSEMARPSRAVRLSPGLELTVRQSHLSEGLAGVVWPSAVLLAQLLHSPLASRLPSGLAVELGAGRGVVALAAAAAGRQVVATDLRGELCHAAESFAHPPNAAAVAQGGGGVSVAAMDWRDPQPPAEADGARVVLAADVLHQAALHAPLRRALRGLLLRGGSGGGGAVCWLAWQVRDPGPEDDFLAALPGAGLRVAHSDLAGDAREPLLAHFSPEQLQFLRAVEIHAGDSGMPPGDGGADAPGDEPEAGIYL